MMLDTSGLLALLDAREPQHELARDAYQRATQRVTHGFVIAEIIALANARGVPLPPVVEFLRALMADTNIELHFPDALLTSQGIAFLAARQGRRYSLCDAVSFLIMHARGINDALTTDHHFSDEGFRRLLE